MDDLRTAKELLRPGDYMVVADLRSAYHHLRLNPQEYELMGIEITNDEGNLEWYKYAVLPFWLGPAAHYLTRLIKPIICLLYTSPSPRDRG